MYGSLDVLGKAFPKFESSMTIIGVSEDAPLDQRRRDDGG